MLLRQLLVLLVVGGWVEVSLHRMAVLIIA